MVKNKKLLKDNSFFINLVLAHYNLDKIMEKTGKLKHSDIIKIKKLAKKYNNTIDTSEVYTQKRLGKLNFSAIGFISKLLTTKNTLIGYLKISNHHLKA